ncbi:MAG: isochorismatase family protein [Variibacter sp.]
MSNRFDDAGYGMIPVGFGTKPAVVVVDFQRAFTDPTFVTGRSPHIHQAVEATAKLLKVARLHGVPVASCRTAWCSEKDVIRWKTASISSGLLIGDPATEMDARIYDAAYDVNFTKAAPSIFFGTPLVSYLTKAQVDTVIVTGCTTSGCVRASIIDAFSWGFRTIVPEDCVGDMEVEPHRANLLDVGRRYADIATASECIDQLSRHWLAA